MYTDHLDRRSETRIGTVDLYERLAPSSEYSAESGGREPRAAGAPRKANYNVPRIMATVEFGEKLGFLLVFPGSDLDDNNLRTHWRNHPSAEKHRLIIEVAEALETLHFHPSFIYGRLKPCFAVDKILPERPFVYDYPSLWDFVEPYQQRLQYLAPEILLAEPRSSQRKTRESDMYAFGMVVYEILSEREPWADAKLVDVFRYIVTGQQIPRPENGTINDSMWNLCTACWNQNPSYRPGIANVLAGLRSKYPPTRWSPNAAAQGDGWLHAERPSSEGYATPTALDVEIAGSIVNIVLQKEGAAAGGFSTVMKGYSYREGVITRYAAKICRGKSVMPREYEIWRSLRHRNILRLLGTVDTDLAGARAVIFVSRYLKNGNLTNFLGSYPTVNRVPLMLGVARGLEYLHDMKEIVHGDIKPENILINDSRQAVLADFGFSTYVAPGPEETLLEMRQVYMLTYCAPEVLDDTAEDPSHPGVTRSKTRMSDMYAYGVLIYQTYAGELGHSRRDRMRLMLDMHDEHFPPRPVDRYPVICDELWSICTRCWAKDPLHRPPIATVLAELKNVGWTGPPSGSLSGRSLTVQEPQY